MNAQQPIDAIRTFFKISVAAFDMRNTIVEAIGQTVTPSVMETLHRLALNESMKDNPDMEFIDNALLRMEELAEINKLNNQK